jgi:hypothetical protein
MGEGPPPSDDFRIHGRGRSNGDVLLGMWLPWAAWNGQLDRLLA